MDGQNWYQIRKAGPLDLEEAARVEEECFPAAEAATRESLRQRLEAFWETGSFLAAVLRENGRMIGFINGALTDEGTIRDEMFERADLHNPNGAYQSIFGLDVIGEYRGRGVAAGLMKELIGQARRQGKKGLILTCKKELLGFYEQFGYKNLGVSASVHGGAVWYDMILEFQDHED